MTNNPTTAFVLAAGLGTRMRPLTDNLPKPLIEVQGRSMIDRALDKLIQVGVKRAVVNVFYLPEMLINHLSKRTDIEIIFSRENERLETGGGILNALHLLGDEPFYVITSDIVWQDVGAPALTKLAQNWRDDLVALLCLQRVNKSYGYDGHGDFEMAADGGLTWRAEGKTSDFVFTGLQIINPVVFKTKQVQEMGKIFPLSKIYKAFMPQTKGVENEGNWYHIGTPEALNGLPVV